MLIKNDIFCLYDRRHRLLEVDSEQDIAWALDLDDAEAWPQRYSWSEVSSLPRAAPKPDQRVLTLSPTPAAAKRRDEAHERLKPLLAAGVKLFLPEHRSKLIRDVATSANCSRTTLYNDLRSWWRGGQTASALLPKFHNCGASQAVGTAARGRPSRLHPTYALQEVDLALFARALKEHYFADSRVKLTNTFGRLLEDHYSTEDGNGHSFIRPDGERPSWRQFEHFFYKNYPLGVRLRLRKGDKDFEREDRATLGTVLDDCLGVGHYFEADATIADVYLVSSEDVTHIIGKPTIYQIIDRKSRLIVGFYIGLENPSWVCAMQAILSICEDKAALCARYGVDYNPEDWPADGVFPSQFLADRGEMFTRASTQLATELEITVTNVPAKRGDWKPVVESGFKLQRNALEDGTPGFDPPENAKRRQGKHYEKDACLTLAQFTTIILNYIIAHNRAPMRSYDLSFKELADNVMPSPIALWNHGVRERAGYLTRYEEEVVRMALLPRAEATVTEDGIFLNHMYYTCTDAMQGGWFVRARRKRFKLLAIFDYRMVDIAYARSPFDPRSTYQLKLTPKCEKYSGKSVSEAKALVLKWKAMQPEIEQDKLQAKADMHRANDAVADKALAKLKAKGKLPARSARKADTKQARAQELNRERAERLEAQMPGQAGAGAPSAKVVPLSQARLQKGEGASSQQSAQPAAAPAAASSVAPGAESLAEKLERMRRQLRGG